MEFLELTGEPQEKKEEAKVCSKHAFQPNGCCERHCYLVGGSLIE